MKRPLFIIGLLCLLVLPVALQAQEPPPVDPLLATQLDGLDDLTAELRELEALASVERAFPTTDDLRVYIQTLTDAELTDEIVLQASVFYQAFDFVDEPLDLRQVYAELLISQVAGFYDTDTRIMNVVALSGEEITDNLPLLERIFYVHEYTHALQDQHFGLATFYHDDLSGDEALARQALVEGDASLVMQNFLTEFLAENPMAALALLSNQDVLEAEIPAGTPPILEAELLMPYLDGLNFVTVLYTTGGWELVNAAFTENPPSATEHILHPETYLNGEQPIAVSVEVGADILGADWQILDEGTLGQFYLREYLATALPRTDAVNASSGWGGDDYALFYDTNSGQHAYLIRLAWDNSAEAEEFMSLFKAFAEARHNEFSLTEVEGASCWVSAADSLCMQMVDDQQVISKAADIEQSLTLLNAAIEG